MSELAFSDAIFLSGYFCMKLAAGFENAYVNIIKRNYMLDNFYMEFMLSVWMLDERHSK